MKVQTNHLEIIGEWHSLYTFVYFVFIATNKDRTRLQVETTGILAQRVHELAQAGEEACIYVVYWEGFASALEALAREKEIKKLSRKKREKLVSEKNTGWQFLNEVIGAAEKQLML